MNMIDENIDELSQRWFHKLTITPELEVDKQAKDDLREYILYKGVWDL